MTRTLNMESSRCRARGADKRQRRRGIEPAVVERAARDGTGELARPRLQQRLHIVDRRETARRNHRNGDAVGERDGGVEIEALEQAVAGNIGVDDRGDAGVGKAARHVVGRKLGRFRPAGDRDPAVARVEPDRDPAFVKSAAQRYPGRVAVGLDARDGKVAVEGWAETSQVTALEIAQRFEDAGVAAIIFTDISRDGLLKGLNLEATIALADRISIPVIASGGLASIEDVKAMLRPLAKKLAGAIAGRALYDGRLDPAATLALIRTARNAAA